MRSTMSSEPTESRSVREWFPVFLEIVARYEVLRQRDEFLEHLAAKLRHVTRDSRNRDRDSNNNDGSAANNSNNS